MRRFSILLSAVMLVSSAVALSRPTASPSRARHRLPGWPTIHAPRLGREACPP